MAVDYNDERFKAVENEKQNALKELNNSYDSMVNSTDQYYQQQIQASKDYAEKQAQLQQENTDFMIEKIEQEKQQSEKDYTREQKGAYSDYQKQTNAYGVNAEQMASSGLNNSGYSESSKVSMYNTYQNRVSTARESFNKAILNYDNSIKEAQLANNSALAEISYNALKTQLELSLEGFQYKNTLLQNQMTAKQNLEDSYYKRWQDVLNQINTENELAEQIRQYNENLALEKQQLELQRQQLYSSGSGGGSYTLTDDSYDDSNASSYYGTFSNGYQPKGISGYGAVSKSGKTVKIVKTSSNGNVNISNQNVWKTPDGSLWYWDGNSRTYKKYKGQKSIAI